MAPPSNGGLSFEMELVVPKIPLLDERGPKVIDDEMRKSLNAGLLIFKGAILPLTPVGVTGHLRQGVQTSITGEAEELTGRVFDPVAYAPPVETGTRPHPVSREGRESIALWVRRKLGVTDEREARSIAFLIARKIRRRGSKPRHFFKRAFEANKDRVSALFVRTGARIRERLMGKGGE